MAQDGDGAQGRGDRRRRVLVTCRWFKSGVRNHLQANYRSVAQLRDSGLELSIRLPPSIVAGTRPRGLFRGWNASLAFSVEGIALAA